MVPILYYSFTKCTVRVQPNKKEENDKREVFQCVHFKCNYTIFCVSCVHLCELSNQKL